MVLDSKHGAVKIFGKDLKFKKSFGSVGSDPGSFNMPQGMEAGSKRTHLGGRHEESQDSAV